MTFLLNIVNHIRAYLQVLPQRLSVKEKSISGSITFFVENRFLISVQGEMAFVRYDPKLKEKLSLRRGYRPLLLEGVEIVGYCYVNLLEVENNKELFEWIEISLAYIEK